MMGLMMMLLGLVENTLKNSAEGLLCVYAHVKEALLPHQSFFEVIALCAGNV
jgi:hypothetical protein